RNQLLSFSLPVETVVKDVPVNPSHKLKEITQSSSLLRSSPLTVH
ncbi:21851_t:CDS:1, partial [Cetraspora pellucida]